MTFRVGREPSSDSEIESDRHPYRLLLIEKSSVFFYTTVPALLLKAIHFLSKITTPFPQVMEDKVRRLEKKLKEATTKLKDAQVNAAVAGGELEGKAGEAGGVASKKLMDEVKEKDNTIGDLKKKVDSLQEQYDKVRKECDDMKNATAYKDRTPKKPRDLTPKSTLVKWVDELETECGKCIVTPLPPSFICLRAGF